MNPARDFRNFPSRHRGRGAVTLVELLAVLALIAAIVAAVAPLVGSLNQKAALTSGANLVAGMIDEARQSARAKNTMTALVLLTDHGSEADYRSFTILRFEPGAGWLQTREWEQLPEGVMVDFSTAESSFLSRGTSSVPLLAAREQQHLPIRFHGRTVNFPDACSARIFMPTGALQNPQVPAQMRLVHGYRDQAEIRYTRPGSGGRPSDFVDITIIGATGSTKIARP